jgi:hypothetical protein
LHCPETILWVTTSEREPQQPETGSRPESSSRRNQAMATWMAIGIVLGAAWGTAMDNLALGLGLGIALGAGIAAIASRRVTEKSDNRSSGQ